MKWPPEWSESPNFNDEQSGPIYKAGEAQTAFRLLSLSPRAVLAQLHDAAGGASRA
jgi:hypothetical protein